MDHPGLRFRLSDFINRGLVQEEMGDLDQELAVSTQRLCEILRAAEVNIRRTVIESRSSPFWRQEKEAVRNASGRFSIW